MEGLLTYGGSDYLQGGLITCRGVCLPIGRSDCPMALWEGSPPVNRITHASENITLSDTSHAGGKNGYHETHEYIMFR